MALVDSETCINKNLLSSEMITYLGSLARRSMINRAFGTIGIAQAQLPPLSRQGPPPLPRKQQQEFEDAVKAASRPAAQSQPTGFTHDALAAEPGGEAHPDARVKPPPEFEGDVNPVTGERGGPKREPVRHNDWSHSGRVTDF
jgi:hypothetical protein